MPDVLQVSANGLIAGSLIALLAVSYSLIYGALRFINFTFGEVLMFSAYGFYLLKVKVGLPSLLSIGLPLLLVTLCATLIQLGAYRPLYRRSRLACLITALGVSLMLQNLALIIFKPGPKTLRGFVPEAVFHWEGVSVTTPNLIMLVAAILMLLSAECFVFRSDYGLRVRALTDNMRMAELYGIPIDRTIALVFLLGSFFAAAAGVLVSMDHLLMPTMGVSPGIQAFAACVAGGIGSIRGSVLMAFVIGLLGHAITYSLPLVTPETSSYAVLLLTLALCPDGLVPRVNEAWSRLMKARSLGQISRVGS